MTEPNVRAGIPRQTRRSHNERPPTPGPVRPNGVARRRSDQHAQPTAPFEQEPVSADSSDRRACFLRLHNSGRTAAALVSWNGCEHVVEARRRHGPDDRISSVSLAPARVGRAYAIGERGALRADDSDSNASAQDRASRLARVAPPLRQGEPTTRPRPVPSGLGAHSKVKGVPTTGRAPTWSYLGSTSRPSSLP